MSTEIRLDGRTAPVAGGGKGPGLAMTTQFAAVGADVAILAWRADVPEKAKRAIREVAEGGIAPIAVPAIEF